jgi:hypothetical protein
MYGEHCAGPFKNTTAAHKKEAAAITATVPFVQRKVKHLLAFVCSHRNINTKERDFHDT